MAEFARERGLGVDVATFEAWDPDGRSFDASSPRSPGTGATGLPAQSKQRALRPGGRLAVFGHVFEPPDEVAEEFAATYRRLVPYSPSARQPARRPLEQYQTMYATFAGKIDETGAFHEPEQWRFDWQRTYTRAQWLDFLPTTGGLTQLPPDTLAELLDHVGSAIDALGSRFTMPSTTLATTAERLGTEQRDTG